MEEVKNPTNKSSSSGLHTDSEDEETRVRDVLTAGVKSLVSVVKE